MNPVGWGRGLRSSTPAKVAHRLGATQHEPIADALRGGIRGSADLSALFPARLNQGLTDTCPFHSLSVALVVACASAGRPLGFVPSPLALASNTYADLRALAHPAGALPPLTDDGSELQDAAIAAARWGVVPIGADVQGRHSDVPADTGYGFPEPTTTELVEGASRLIGGEYAIAVDDALPETIAASLDAGIPVWIGGLVGAAYQGAAAASVQDPAPSSDKTASGHAQVIGGYRVVPGTGEIQARVWNSWGNGWALDGTVWVSSAWMRGLWSAWPMAVAS